MDIVVSFSLGLFNALIFRYCTLHVKARGACTCLSVERLHCYSLRCVTPGCHAALPGVAVPENALQCTAHPLERFGNRRNKGEP